MKVNDKNQNLILVVFILLVSWFLLSWLRDAPDSVMSILLYPHKLMAELFYNIDLNYIEGAGYGSYGWAFVIGRECLGYNFTLLLFSMTACTFIKHFSRMYKFIWLGACFGGSLVIGILASTMRIIGSILFLNNEKFALIHLTIGTFIYFLTLVAVFGLIKFFVGRVRLEKAV